MNPGTPVIIKISRVIIWMVLIVYLLVLTKMVLFKSSPSSIKQHFLHHYNWQRVKQHAKEGNYKPLTTINLYLHSRGRIEYSINNLAGNIVGFMPLGLLLPLLFRSMRSAWKIIVASFLLSLAFEVTQLLTILGSFDVDDLLLNTAGGFLGYGIFMIFFYNVAKPHADTLLPRYQEIPVNRDI
jgi:glycopeptide antibiotics resistance protein